MPPKNLPEHAKEIYMAAEASAMKTTCKDRPDKEACANSIAWSAVKRKYKKVGDEWVPKADLTEFTFAITKAAYIKESGEMKWFAVCSDTDYDSYGDRMSVELFEDFVRRAEAGEMPPLVFCSDFWKGGLPYLSIAHYSDQNGKAVPGEVTKIYRDGNRLKAQGRFFDNPLGSACFRAICEDLYVEEKKSREDKVRISIGFLDWAHKHGGVEYTRQSLSDRCPMCAKKTPEKQYLSGHLIHMAMTRVPVNKRTDILPELEERSMATKKSDAASIIGEELAEQIDVTEALVGRSEMEDLPLEALVERADEEDVESQAEEPKVQAAEAVVEEAEIGGTPVAETAYRPLGGSKSFEEYDQYIATQEEAAQVYDTLYMMEAMMNNILSDHMMEMDGKKKAMKKLMGDAKKRMDMKSMIALEKLSLADDTVSRQAPLVASHILQTPFDEFKSAFDQVYSAEATPQEKLMALQPALEKMALAIRSQIETVSEPEVTDPPAADAQTLKSDIVAAVRDMLQPLADNVSLLMNQSSAKQGVQVVTNSTPQRRSISPIVVKSESNVAEKPNSLKNLARRSVGLL